VLFLVTSRSGVFVRLKSEISIDLYRIRKIWVSKRWATRCVNFGKIELSSGKYRIYKGFLGSRDEFCEF